MRAPLILMIAILCASCMTGKLPCPEPKYAKAKKNTIHRRFMESSGSLSADAESNTSNQNKVPKNNVRTISNVSVEEWDCPRPGKKKYLPKEIKHNIRKNMQKIKSKEQEEKPATETAPEATH